MGICLISSRSAVSGCIKCMSGGLARSLTSERDPEGGPWNENGSSGGSCREPKIASDMNVRDLSVMWYVQKSRCQVLELLNVCKVCVHLLDQSTPNLLILLAGNIPTLSAIPAFDMQALDTAKRANSSFISPSFALQ